MSDYNFTLTGTSPLLMHADNIEAADIVEKWRKNPKNKGVSRRGDDRSPAWTWQSYCYFDTKGILSIPGDCVQSALNEAGGKMTAIQGKGSLKRSVAAGILIPTEFLSFRFDGRSVSITQIDEVRELEFDRQKAAMRKIGFDLHAKRAKIGKQKHVRVRPRFENWTVTGSIEVLLPEFKLETIQELFDIAGSRIGIGDWRPNSPTSPGSFGKFSAVVEKL